MALPSDVGVEARASNGLASHTKRTEPTVLVVESRPGTLSVFCLRLDAFGIHSRFVCDAAEALAILQHERVALVLADAQGQGMDGLHLLLEVRDLPPPVGMVPFIVITSSSKETDMVRYLQAGADDCISTPFSPHVLLERIRRLVARR